MEGRIEMTEMNDEEHYFLLWLIDNENYDEISILAHDFIYSVSSNIDNYYTIFELTNYLYSRNGGIEIIEKLDNAYLVWKDKIFASEQFQRERIFKCEQAQRNKILKMNRVAIENKIPVPPMKG